MSPTHKNLPNDVDTLKDVIIENYYEMQRLKENIRLYQAALSGSKSEKKYPEPTYVQQSFPGFESQDTSEEKEEEIAETIEVKPYKRKKRGRKPLPEYLPVIEKYIDISDEEKLCGCGCQKVVIGKEEHNALEHIPAQYSILRTIRLKYACKNCEGTEDSGPTVTIAPVPAQIIPKSFATSSLLAYIIAAKFVDALPFYRLSKIFQREGISLGRGTMSNWTITLSKLLEPMLEALKDSFSKYPVAYADETTLQVLNEPDRRAQQKSYMWVFCGGPPDKKSIIFEYSETRATDVPQRFFGDYSGYIMSDGYIVYKYIDKENENKRLRCWVHGRRKFTDAIKSAGNNATPGVSHKAVKIIAELYAIEKEIKLNDLTYREIYDLRQEKAKPILIKFKKKLDLWKEALPPKSKAGGAVQYFLNDWDVFKSYIDDGRLPIDNNLAENAIRPFVIGRKNWLFSNTPAGAKAMATILSIIESAKANNIEPYWYLRILFEKLPELKTKEDFLPYLPQNIDRALIDNLRNKTIECA